jgi:methylenetetrahydrofolate reductase (NADPH)
VRISIELVPRSHEALAAELARVRTYFPVVDTINLPDVSAFPLRSWEGCAAVTAPLRAIPHLRAVDIDLTKPLPMAAAMTKHGVSEVLVVGGDTAPSMSRTLYPTTSIELIRKLRHEHPELIVYAALDPYRQSFRGERDYALRKLEAGAVGLFTQPFFDLRLLAIYAELLPDVPIFWGVTSVLGERTKQYWLTRNHAILPADFAPTLAWNRRLAANVLAFAKARGDNVYFMPIKTDLVRYLEGIL